MQYTQRKLQRSVTETRRSCSRRPRVSSPACRGWPEVPLRGRGFVRCPSLMGMTRSVTRRVAVSGKAVRNSSFAEPFSIAGNMPYPSLAVSVVMERTPLENNRWESEKWEPIGVVPDMGEPGAPPRALVQDSSRSQWLYPGFKLQLFHDEAEGYYLNLSSQKPFVFVIWLEEGGAGVPKAVTVSYNEAARQL